MAQDKIPFLDMFASCVSDGDLSMKLRQAFVTQATVDRAERSMKIESILPAGVSPADLRVLETAIAEEYGLSFVEIVPYFAPAPEVEEKKSAKPSAKPIMGKAVKGKPMPISDINLESGKVIIQGEIFAVECREIE